MRKKAAQEFEMIEKPSSDIGYLSLILLLVISLSANVYMANKLLFPSRSLIQTSTPKVMSSEPTLTNELLYSLNLPNNFKFEEGNPLSILSVSDIRSDIMSSYANNSCFANCAVLAGEGDFDKLDMQFEILKKAATAKNCVVTDELREEIDQFNLLSAGISTKQIKDLIYVKNLNLCGIKYVGMDGYDAWLGNGEYNAVFLLDDEIINVYFPLFPIGVFDDIDKLWESFGYDMENGVCDSICYSNVLDYLENLDYMEPEILKTIKAYDDVVRTLNLK